MLYWFGLICYVKYVKICKPYWSLRDPCWSLLDLQIQPMLLEAEAWRCIYIQCCQEQDATQSPRNLSLGLPFFPILHESLTLIPKSLVSILRIRLRAICIIYFPKKQPTNNFKEWPIFHKKNLNCIISCFVCFFGMLWHALACFGILCHPFSSMERDPRAQRR